MNLSIAYTMLDQAIRFGAILERPEFAQGGLLLEVGSGAVGVSAFVGDTIIAADVRFNSPPSESIRAVMASALHLPFRSAAFGRVVCSDMLEHLPADQRRPAIHEILRVAGRTVFLACPCDLAARKTDARFARLYQLLHVTPPDWLVEHLENVIPDAQEIENALLSGDCKYSEGPGERTLAHSIVVLLIASRWLNRLWRRLLYQQPERAIRLSHLASRLGRHPYRRLWVVNRSIS